MARPEAPEFALLSPASKSLVRKVGETRDHEIKTETGEPGKGWTTLEDEGWIRIRRNPYGGYVINFTLSGWERWGRQSDAEDGRPLEPLEYD